MTSQASRRFHDKPILFLHIPHWRGVSIECTASESSRLNHSVACSINRHPNAFEIWHNVVLSKKRRWTSRQRNTKQDDDRQHLCKISVGTLQTFRDIQRYVGWAPQLHNNRETVHSNIQVQFPLGIKYFLQRLANSKLVFGDRVRQDGSGGGNLFSDYIRSECTYLCSQTTALCSSLSTWRRPSSLIVCDLCTLHRTEKCIHLLGDTHIFWTLDTRPSCSRVKIYGCRRKKSIRPAVRTILISRSTTQPEMSPGYIPKRNNVTLWSVRLPSVLIAPYHIFGFSRTFNIFYTTSISAFGIVYIGETHEQRTCFFCV